MATETLDKLDLQQTIAELGLTIESTFVPFSQSRNRDKKMTSYSGLDIALKLRNGIGEDGLAKLREASQDY